MPGIRKRKSPSVDLRRVLAEEFRKRDNSFREQWTAEAIRAGGGPLLGQAHKMVDHLGLLKRADALDAGFPVTLSGWEICSYLPRIIQDRVNAGAQYVLEWNNRLRSA